MQREIEGFRLSPQQKRLWSLQQTTSAYCAQCVILLEGHLDIKTLEAALQRIVNRHGALRTTFHRRAGIRVPIQVVEDLGNSMPLKFKPTHVSSAQLELPIEELIKQERSEPFDFERGPLMRASLLALSADRHFLILTLPSLCADARTLKNLVEESIRFYTTDSQCLDISDEVVQYTQFSEWQNELIEDPDANEGKEFWRKRSVTSADNLALAWESKLEGETEFEPEFITLDVDCDLVPKIDELAARYEVSADTFLLACWQVLLWRLTGHTNILVGYLVHGRKYEELAEAMGLFAKLVPVRCRFQPDLPFVDILRENDRSARDSAAWQEYFKWDEISPMNKKPEAPLFFSIGFGYEERAARTAASGLVFTHHRQYSCFDRYKIYLSCVRKSNTLATEFYFDPNCYSRETIKYIGQLFSTLMKSAVSSPLDRISELKILDEADRHQLITAFNPLASDYPVDKCIHQLIEEQVERTPDRIAVVFQEEQLTYAELNARANRLAHFLSRRGLAPGLSAGLSVDRSVEMLVGLLGILKAGAAYVPLEAGHPKARLSSQIAEIKMPLLISQERLLNQLPAFEGELVCLDRDHALLAAESRDNPESKITPQYPCYVIFTSGSTGTPKGVAVCHQNLVNYTHFLCRKLDQTPVVAEESMKFATAATLSADLGNTAIFPSLVSGACLHIIGFGVATDSPAFVTYLREHSIDVLKIVPSHLSALLPPPTEKHPLPRRYLILGGEPLSFELVERIAKTSNGCQVINHYGPTETTIGSLTHVLGEGNESIRMASTVPIGRPVANTDIYILDRHFEPAPMGVPGELYIGGEGVALGYLNRPEQTAERFLPNPFSRNAKARLYKTGDLVRYLPNGEVEFLGRVDNQVKIRGFRVELGEIEKTLNQHPDVRETVALVREDESGRKRLVAYFVPDREPTPTLNQLRSFLERRLPEFMMPSVFVALKALPLTDNGKIDRRGLPAPEQARHLMEHGYVSPETPIQKVLADIWSQVIGVERVGIYDNFFELGGDSILSLQIVARAKAAGIRLNPKQIFQHRTISELSLVAGSNGLAQSKQHLVIGQVPLTPIQHWFFEQNFPAAHHWNYSVVLQLRQAMDPEALEEAARHLLIHHDGLRLRFIRGVNGWEQFYGEYGQTLPFFLIDLSGLPRSDQESVFETVTAELQTSLDLGQGPLLRVAMFEFGAKRPGRLLLVIHHLVIDGVSLRILLEDLQTAYQHSSQGELVRLPQKTSSFQQWSKRLEEYANSEAVQQELLYWLADQESSIYCLPRDRQQGANTVASSRIVSVKLTVEETEALLREAPRAYNTEVNDLLLTGLLRAFAKWTGVRFLLIDLEGHGREGIDDNLDVSRTAGWFTTHFPVLLKLETHTDPGDVLKSVKEQLRRIPNHGIGYGLLRYLNRELDITRELQARPRPEVKFNYLGQFDNYFSDISLFSRILETPGQARSPYANRPHLLEINGGITGDRLRMDWTYSENVYRRATVERLAQSFIRSLKSLIAHCQSPETGGYTPSDFPQAELSQEALDRLMAKISHVS